MDNVLNLVYDDWDEINNQPNINKLKNFYEGEWDNYNWIRSDESFLCLNQNVNIKNWKLSDVPNFPEKIFYYHIWCRSSYYVEFFSKNILPVNSNVIDFIKNNNNLNLILMNESETEPFDSLKSLSSIIKCLEIDAKKVWFVHNGVRLYDDKQKLNTKINVHATNHLIDSQKSFGADVKYVANKNPNHFFLCHNRSKRIHRYGILCLLKKYNILHDVDWSLISGYSFEKEDKKMFLGIFNLNDIFELWDEITYFCKIQNKRSYYEIEHDASDKRGNIPIPCIANTYENSYVNITTETNFEDDSIHISEKSFKPFYFYQFPLILGSYEHIKYLKKTWPELDLFEDMIDYSYDSIKNNRNRLFAFADEVKRIHDNKEFFIEFYNNNEDRFIKNSDFIRNYENKKDYEFIKTLINGRSFKFLI